MVENHVEHCLPQMLYRNTQSEVKHVGMCQTRRGPKHRGFTFGLPFKRCDKAYPLPKITLPCATQQVRFPEPLT